MKKAKLLDEANVPKNPPIFTRNISNNNKNRRYSNRHNNRESQPISKFRT